jgi:hypothetical protein
MELVEVTVPVTRTPGVQGPANAGHSFDLTSLSQVQLSENHQAMLQFAAPDHQQTDPLLVRMVNEARDVLALSEIAPPGRLRIDWIDISGSTLAIVMLMRVVVPRVPDSANQLRLGQLVRLGLTYPRAAISQVLPGTAFFDVIQPLDGWHPSISIPGPAAPIPRLCLGPELMAGIRCVDLILMAYGALCMQTLQIDERDPAGVMNIQAALWWQQNLHRLPLSTTPFLQADAPATVSPPTTKT